ncbi:metalloendoproteinase 2-MMP-like [Vicia villosa]|uniref:metalloendoproteinase 2-MMP-like n=1 Tax=Vicia villosa TaxID=3911 RepID=UPI00273C9C4A|nr:metalloendoproteinase 2-MMP-like [Vicia villosa]XP_058777043.1 metalloendoproteinase 2-MMP-like [Vicia villosa]
MIDSRVFGQKWSGLLTAVCACRSRIPLFLKRIISRNWFSRLWNSFKSIFQKALKIGDTAKELPDLKDFLHFSGYLNSSTSNPNFTDEFTVNLQSAIIKFQKTFNLKTSGQLDENTYNILSKPRCGVPDIVNETTTMSNDVKSFKPWWTGKELKYAFHPENNLPENVKSLFQDAFNRWSKVTALDFVETVSFNGSDIRIAFVTMDGKGGMVGGGYVNNSVHVGSIYLDAEENWVVSSKSAIDEDDVDLESFVMHQIGHLLGLGHSSVEESIMYPIVLPKKKIELVNDDDLQKIQQIYGVTVTP